MIARVPCARSCWPFAIFSLVRSLGRAKGVAPWEGANEASLGRVVSFEGARIRFAKL